MAPPTRAELIAANTALEARVASLEADLAMLLRARLTHRALQEAMWGAEPLGLWEPDPDTGQMFTFRRFLFRMAAQTGRLPPDATETDL